VLDSTNHVLYTSAQAGNTGHALTDTAWWTPAGPSNARAAFDLYRNTPTVAPLSFTVVITPGQRVDGFAALGLAADSVRVIVNDGVSNQYDTTVSMGTREVFDWYDYFFAPFTARESVALFDLPPYYQAVITVTVTAASGNAECGALVFGMQEYLGVCVAGAESDVINFSSVDRDAAGNSIMTPRRNAPRTVNEVRMEAARLNKIRSVRDALNATPAVWFGIDDTGHDYFDALLILGFYRRFVVDLRDQDTPILSLELEEV